MKKDPEIILALDVDTIEKAEQFVDKLYPKIKVFKVDSPWRIKTSLYMVCETKSVKGWP